jgi:hypothetical protein
MDVVGAMVGEMTENLYFNDSHSEIPNCCTKIENTKMHMNTTSHDNL